MWLRALLAFVLLPGIVAVAIPILVLWLSGERTVSHAWGLALSATGLVVLLWCVRDFYVAGKGTLAPWSPPQRLVRTGLYRVTRNPMYLAVLGLVMGLAIAFASLPLLGYLLLVAIGFHLRVTRAEEHWLAHRYGAAWNDYVRQVPRRWLW